MRVGEREEGRKNGSRENRETEVEGRKIEKRARVREVERNIENVCV
jgi:hypothetical protein